MLDSPSIAIAVEAASLKRWTVEDYHRMSELGILEASERTELIAGQITVMAAKGTPRVTALRLLATQLDAFLRDRPFFAITQDPVHLKTSSMPKLALQITGFKISKISSFTFFESRPRLATVAARSYLCQTKYPRSLFPN